MPGLDAPAPPLGSLSASTTEWFEITDHILPDLIEVLKGILGGGPLSDKNTHRIYDAFMRTGSNS